MTSVNPSEASPFAGQSRLPSLTGLRFVAAAMVFAFHAMYQALFAEPQTAATLSSIFLQGGWAGVSFFFILSGFVLTWVARPTDTVPGFWRRRLLKIYPNYLVTYVVALLLLLVVAGATVGTDDALLALLLVHAWSPRMETILAVNPVGWSLSCELLFYLLFPFLLRALNRIRPDRLWAWAGAVVVAILLMPSVARLLPDQPVVPYPEPTSAWNFWFLYIFPPVRLLEFVLGILLARLVLTGHRLPVRLGGAVALAVAAYALAPLFPLVYTYVAVMVVPLGLVIAAAAVTDVQERRRTWLAHPGMVWLGEISFAFYLWHPMVLTYGHRWLGEGRSWDTPVALGVLALLFTVTVLLSWLLHTRVERPIMRRFAARHQASATPPPTAVVPVPAGGNRADLSPSAGRPGDGRVPEHVNRGPAVPGTARAVAAGPRGQLPPCAAASTLAYDRGTRRSLPSIRVENHFSSVTGGRDAGPQSGRYRSQR